MCVNVLYTMVKVDEVECQRAARSQSLHSASKARLRQHTCDIFHIVHLRPADVNKILAVRLQCSWLKVIYFLDTMVLRGI